MRPRRLFVRLDGDEAIVGGLDRTDTATGLDDEVAGLLAATTGNPVHNGEAQTPENEEPQA